MKIDPGGKTGRRPGSVSSREALLEAARDQFMQHGYKGATLRAIASQAGADPTLIRHFFGNKDGLFAAVMQLPAGATQMLMDVFEGPENEWGVRLARAYLSLWDEPGTAEPLRAVLVSAFTNDQALEQFREVLVSVISDTAFRRLPQDNPGLRLTIAMSHLVGTALARYLMQAPALVEQSVDSIAELIGPTLQQYLTGPLPSSVLASEPSAVAPEETP